jgi:hypothetical protein
MMRLVLALSVVVLLAAKQFPAPPRLAEPADRPPMVHLSTAPAKQIDEMQQRNKRGAVPAQNGFSRAFPQAVSVRVNASSQSTERGVAWSGSFKVDNADQLRLRLDKVKLPKGAVLWVRGTGEQPIGFDKGLLDPKGTLWTPTTTGDTIHLAVEIPKPKRSADEASFVVREVMQLVAPRPAKR